MPEKSHALKTMVAILLSIAPLPWVRNQTLRMSRKSRNSARLREQRIAALVSQVETQARALRALTVRASTGALQEVTLHANDGTSIVFGPSPNWREAAMTYAAFQNMVSMTPDICRQTLSRKFRALLWESFFVNIHRIAVDVAQDETESGVAVIQLRRTQRIG